MTRARPWPRLALSAALFAAALLLPTIPLSFWGPAGPRPPEVQPGWVAFALSFQGLGMTEVRLSVLPGAAANLAYLSALVAGLLGRRGASQALGLAAVAAGLASLMAVPQVLPRPGWWTWVASFAALALPGVRAWWRAPRRRLRAEAAHAAAVGAPLAALGCAALLPRAYDWTPLAVLLPPPVAVATSCAVGAWLIVLGLRLGVAQAEPPGGSEAHST